MSRSQCNGLASRRFVNCSLKMFIPKQEQGVKDIPPSSALVSQSLPERIEVGKCTLEIGSLLGSGGFGSVFEGTFRGKKVAIKKLHLNSKNPHAVTESFHSESAIRQLRHKNIVRIIAVSSSDPSCHEKYIVMEFAGRRNLQTIIDDESERLPELRRVRYLLDLTKALNYIHNCNIAHLDIKPANVLVGDEDHCKLGDFGCCKTLSENGQCSPTTPTKSFLTGTLAYRAPELLRGGEPSNKADMYSLGICMWQLLTRDKPYGTEHLYVAVFGVVAHNLRPKIDAANRDNNRLYVQLTEQLWQADPADRPCAYEVIATLKSKWGRKLGLNKFSRRRKAWIV